MTDATLSPAAAAVAPAPVPGKPFVRHVGRASELLSITLVNLLLKVVTLGVYHFWAKTRVRQYVWSRTHFQGEAFEYTGRPVELLLGYLIALLVLIPVLGYFQVMPFLIESHPVLGMAGSAVAYVLLIFLGGFAAFSSKRYMLSRTRWRSIRFGMSGRARDHGLKTLLYMLLTAITGGLFTPLMRNRLTAHLVNNIWFGSERFGYDGRDNALLLRFLAVMGMMIGGYVLMIVAIVAGTILSQSLLEGTDLPEIAGIAPVLFGIVIAALVVPGISLIWMWYVAGEWRYIVGHTTLAGARFSLELPTRRYVWLAMTNLTALVFTLGLAYPWVVVRTGRTFANALRMHGTLDVESIAQHAGRPPGTGEGLADALDLGSI